MMPETASAEPEVPPGLCYTRKGEGNQTCIRVLVPLASPQGGTMHREPIPVAFVVAAGASAILAPPVHGADFGVIVLGSTLAAATTGIIAAAMQFLPHAMVQRLHRDRQRGDLDARVESARRRWVSIWLGPIPERLGIAWALGAATALLASRASGMGLPGLRPCRWRRQAAASDRARRWTSRPSLNRRSSMVGLSRYLSQLVTSCWT